MARHALVDHVCVAEVGVAGIDSGTVSLSQHTV